MKNNEQIKIITQARIGSKILTEVTRIILWSILTEILIYFDNHLPSQTNYLKKKNMETIWAQNKDYLKHTPAARKYSTLPDTFFEIFEINKWCLNTLVKGLNSFMTSRFSLTSIHLCFIHIIFFIWFLYIFEYSYYFFLNFWDR